MTRDTVLWLALLVVLGALFVATFRRMSVLVARTRDLERFQKETAALDGRFAAVAEPLVRALDEARRHAGDPDALRAGLPAAQAELAGLVTDARTLSVPTGLDPIAAVLREELDRAVRAAALVEHGLGSMSTASIGRDLEAQTSLKRGALNLRHAREAFARAVRKAEALRPADLAPRRDADGAVTAGLAPYPDTDPDDVEARFDPRM
jgi:hypothetical protein